MELGQLLNHKVTNKWGEILGRVDDIIVNVRDARIEYIKLLIQADGESPKRLIAIPWSQFRMNGINAGIELDISWKVLNLMAASH